LTVGHYVTSLSFATGAQTMWWSTRIEPRDVELIGLFTEAGLIENSIQNNCRFWKSVGPNDFPFTKFAD
jgi:hypothetical protein